MQIEQHNTRTKGEFSAHENGRDAGHLYYSWAGIDKMIINHTEVLPGFEHQGIGQQLVMEAVKYARANKIKILPLCPFTKSVFKKHPELADVVF